MSIYVDYIKNIEAAIDLVSLLKKTDGNPKDLPMYQLNKSLDTLASTIPSLEEIHNWDNLYSRVAKLVRVYLLIVAHTDKTWPDNLIGFMNKLFDRFMERDPESIDIKELLLPVESAVLILNEGRLSTCDDIRNRYIRHGRVVTSWIIENCTAKIRDYSDKEDSRFREENEAILEVLGSAHSVSWMSMSSSLPSRAYIDKADTECHGVTGVASRNYPGNTGSPSPTYQPGEVIDGVKILSNQLDMAYKAISSGINERTKHTDSVNETITGIIADIFKWGDHDEKPWFELFTEMNKLILDLPHYNYCALSSNLISIEPLTEAIIETYGRRLAQCNLNSPEYDALAPASDFITSCYGKAVSSIPANKLFVYKHLCRFASSLTQIINITNAAINRWSEPTSIYDERCNRISMIAFVLTSVNSYTSINYELIRGN